MSILQFSLKVYKVKKFSKFLLIFEQKFKKIDKFLSVEDVFSLRANLNMIFKLAPMILNKLKRNQETSEKI